MTPRHLEYAPRYFRRLKDIHERIAADNSNAAGRMIERIRAAVARLAASPALGRPGRVAGTRELVIPGTPYIVPYRVAAEFVQIITIPHGRAAMARQVGMNVGRAACHWPARFCAGSSPARIS